MTQQPPWGQPPAQQQPWQGQGPVAPAAQSGPAPMTPFNSPGSAAGGAGTIKLHQLNGRLLLLKVVSYDPTSPGYQGGDPSPQAVCECAVLDGPPITAITDGRTQQPTAQIEQPATPPFYLPVLYCGGAVLAARNLAPYVGQYVVGRLGQGTQGTKGNPPWMLNDPTPEEMAFAQQVGAAWEQLKATTTVRKVEAPTPPPAAQQAFTQNPPPWGGQAQQYSPQGQNYPPQGQPAPAQPWQQPQGGQQAAPPWGYQGQ